MPKGRKKTKGTPELYNEVKKQVSLSLTPTAISKLDGLAEEHKLSRSEFVEQVARGLIPPMTTKRENSISKEFILYPTHLLSFGERNKLPECMGSFIVSDLINFAYIDSCSNLKKRFQSNNFIERIKKLSEKSDEYLIFWIKCDRPTELDRIESELIDQFRGLNTCIHFFSSFRDLASKTKLLPINTLSNNINTNDSLSNVDDNE